jgi:hypothetical protein
MISHSVFFFKTYLSLDLLHLLLLAILKPTYGTSIAYGQNLEEIVGDSPTVELSEKKPIRETQFNH